MIRARLLCLALVLLSPRPAKPDGGAVVFTAATHSLVFTVFISPSPVHAGQADLSLLLQRETDRTPILNAQITAVLVKPGTDPVETTLTHGAATDKLLYAASVNLPEAGTYQLTIKTRSAQVTGALNVLGEEAPLVAYWPYFAVVPLALVLTFMNRYLKARRQASAESDHRPA